MNWVGTAAAVAMFCGIWCGHVAVRKIEFNAPKLWPPTLTFAVLGLALEWLSLSSNNQAFSAFWGILGITLLCDAYELLDQEKRVRKGRAPANPNNPRHAKILSECPAAITVDLLKRAPSTDN